MLPLAACAAGWVIAHRVLQERNPLLVGSLGPLVGALLLILAANWTPREHLFVLPYFFGALALAGLALKGPEWAWPRHSRGVNVTVTVTALLVLGFTHYHQLRFLDTDMWIHEALIGSYIHGVFPPVHPFFPEFPLNGHYGRDLLVATLTPLHADPLGATWGLNLVLQTCGFLALFGSVSRFTGSPLQGIVAALMAYFGVCTGFRVGLIDTFDGNNGVTYTLLILIFYLMMRVLRGEGWRVAVVAGVLLGAYQLVYETHFGLMMLTGLTIAVFFVRERRIWLQILVVATLALGLAAVEGGPISDLIARRGAHHYSNVETNLSQRVQARFPKEHFAQVMVTTAEYQRLSVAYKTSFFKGLRPRIEGTGYMSVFDPRFFPLHWLPLYLAPLTLWCLYRHQHQTGLAFWVFGAWAYAIPAVVDFGPIYEWEFYRWEFAAGMGWAAALGISLALVLGSEPEAAGDEDDEGQPEALIQAQSEPYGWTLKLGRRFPRAVAAGLVLVAALAAGEKLLNDAVIDIQKHPMAWFPDPGQWRAERPELGLDKVDLQATRWLSERVKTGERVVNNLGSETPQGIWPDTGITARTGALPAGRAVSPHQGEQQNQPGGQGPCQYRSPSARAFLATGRPELLSSRNIQWLYLDPDRIQGDWLDRLEGLESSPEFSDTEGHRRRVYRLPPAPREAAHPTSVEARLNVSQADLRTGRHYPVELRFKESVEGVVRTRVVSPEHTEDPLDIQVQGESVTHSLVTPLIEGSYQLQISFPPSEEVAVSLPFEVNFETRLRSIRGRLDLPGAFHTKQILRMRLGLTSQAALDTAAFEFFYRLKQEGGDYLWDWSDFPQPIELVLEPGQEREYFILFVTPHHPGTYLTELFLRDKETGREYPLAGDYAPIHVAPKTAGDVAPKTAGDVAP